MPWNEKSFKSRHNHALSVPQAKKASSIANAILRSGASEKIAIATANKRVNNLRKRGVISDRQADKFASKR
jgi:uncharacterized protein YdaT